MAGDKGSLASGGFGNHAPAKARRRRDSVLRTILQKRSRLFTRSPLSAGRSPEPLVGSRVLYSPRAQPAKKGAASRAKHRGLFQRTWMTPRNAGIGVYTGRGDSEHRLRRKTRPCATETSPRS